MATSQMAAGDRDGAVAVYRAAIAANVNVDHLRKRCLALTGVDPGTDAEDPA